MVPKGKLLVIGGKEDKNDTDVNMEKTNGDFIPEEILKLLVPSKDDRIEVITTASSEPESIRESYRETFTKIGYTNFDFLHITRELHTDLYERRISGAKTVFFSGGDQETLCKELNDSTVIDLLKKKYTEEENFIIAGTSAGAMAIPDIMITEAENGEAIIGQDIKFAAGFGFITNCIVDTHFVRRGRFGRLAHSTLINREILGIGLGEDTALLIENGKDAICKGSGMVTVICARDITESNIETVEKGNPVYVENLKVHLLTDSCTLNLETGKMSGN